MEIISNRDTCQTVVGNPIGSNPRKVFGHRTAVKSQMEISPGRMEFPEGFNT
jgi:hypothetical protein